MGNPAILKAALEKAKANGWAYKHELDRLHVEYLLTFNGGMYTGIIFSPAFAKALWGEEEISPCGPCGFCALFLPAWQHHLQQMAIADNRLEYLGANT